MSEVWKRGSAGAPPPEISVVVPTIGRIDPLGRCIRALQTAALAPERFEVLVVNDGGGGAVDELVRVAAGGPSMRCVTAAGTGPSAARNSGAAAARGGYLAFTDDDCEPGSGWLPALLCALGANPGAAVGGTVKNGFPSSAGAVASQMVVDALQAGSDEIDETPRFFPTSNIAFPAEAFRAVGGFDEAFRYAEDRELCRRWIGLGYRLVAAPEAVVVHMRELGPRDFVRQHYGYGRGARVFHRGGGDDPRGGSSRRVARRLAGRVARQHDRRLLVAGYVAISQLATAAGYAREIARR